MKRTTVGTFAWARATGGVLTFRDRMVLLPRLLGPGLAASLRTLARSGRNVALSLDEIRIPDSAAVSLAHEEMAEACSPPLVQHSLRTYLWAAGFAHVDGIRHDPELLLVASLLHDVGLSDRRRSESCRCFTLDSAIAAAGVLGKAGWDEARTTVVADAICLHMNGCSSLEDGAEAYLLQQATACDVVGTRYYDFEKRFRDSVVRRHPRLKVNGEVSDLMRNEAKTRRSSRAALLCSLGLPLMVRMNPFGE